MDEELIRKELAECLSTYNKDWKEGYKAFMKKAGLH